MTVDQKAQVANAREEQQMSNEETSKTEVDPGPASKPKWADLFGMAPDFGSEQFGIESTQPATEHHVGMLDLSGEGDRVEVASPISDEVVERSGRAYWVNYGEQEATALMMALSDQHRTAIRAALEAAYPSIREQVAEEIATKASEIAEAFQKSAEDHRAIALEHGTKLPRGKQHMHTAIAFKNNAAGAWAVMHAARDIGGRGVDPSAPASPGGTSGRTGLSASPSDPPAGKAGRSESGGFEG